MTSTYCVHGVIMIVRVHAIVVAIVGSRVAAIVLFNTSVDCPAIAVATAVDAVGAKYSRQQPRCTA